MQYSYQQPLNLPPQATRPPIAQSYQLPPQIQRPQQAPTQQPQFITRPPYSQPQVQISQPQTIQTQKPFQQLPQFQQPQFQPPRIPQTYSQPIPQFRQQPSYPQPPPSVQYTQNIPPQGQFVTKSPLRAGPPQVTPQLNAVVTPNRFPSASNSYVTQQLPPQVYQPQPQSVQKFQPIYQQPQYQTIPFQPAQPIFTQQPVQIQPQQIVQQPTIPAEKPKLQPPQKEPQQDKDLERKFEEAINKTKQLVEKYQTLDDNTQKQNFQPEYLQPPQEQNSNTELQDLALQYEDGYIYRGQGIEPSTREGFGILCDQDENEVYSGNWHDNQYHGDGRLFNFQAEKIDGAYDYSDLNNIENFWSSYEGNFKDGKMHGKGILSLTNGEKFDGTFDDGNIEGPGCFTTQDGSEINGYWKDGMLEQVYQ